MLRQSAVRALARSAAPTQAVKAGGYGFQAGGYGAKGGYGKMIGGYGAGQKRQAHAISNPTLADIEKRWEAMPPQEQADLWMALRDRMKVNWGELTVQEKKAAYYIAFGAHGPRAQEPANEPWVVFGYVLAGIGASAALFGFIRFFARGPPGTMNKEYQEATNEYLKGQNSNPISGISSEGYKGPGYVQSAPKAK